MKKFEIFLVIIGICLLVGMGMVDAAWYNSTWEKCKNITLTESKGYTRNYEPITFNITGLTISNATEEIRIIDGSCDGSGTEVPSQVISYDTTWANIVFQANVTASTTTIFSVYYDTSTSVSAPNYSVGAQLDDNSYSSGDELTINLITGFGLKFIGGALTDVDGYAWAPGDAAPTASGFAISEGATFYFRKDKSPTCTMNIDGDIMKQWGCYNDTKIINYTFYDRYELIRAEPKNFSNNSNIPFEGDWGNGDIKYVGYRNLSFDWVEETGCAPCATNHSGWVDTRQDGSDDTIFMLWNYSSMFTNLSNIYTRTTDVFDTQLNTWNNANTNISAIDKLWFGVTNSSNTTKKERIYQTTMYPLEDTFTLGTEEKYLITDEADSFSTTEYELFSGWINLTLNSSASNLTTTLWYNGTSYSITPVNTAGDSWKASKLFNFSSSNVGSNDFHWNLVADEIEKNTSSQSQWINSSILGLCNSTLTEVYLNFTFKDEVSGSFMGANVDSSTWTYWGSYGANYKTLSYSNTTHSNTNYGFCFYPLDRTINTNLTFKFNNDSYIQRTYSLIDSDFTNTTTNTVLYLLSSSDGIYSVYQVQTSSGSSIEGVSVTVERQISGVWTTLETGETDSAGAVTFWLNPNYDHKFVFTKTGYTSVTVTVRPSSSTYTLVMTTAVGDTEYTSESEGLRWTYGPSLGILSQNTTYDFWFNISDTKGNLIAYKLELLNNNSVVLGTTTGSTSGGGNLSISLNTFTNRSIRARFSADVGDGYFILDADAYWAILTTDIPTRGTIKSFFQNLRNLDLFGDDAGRQEYSRIILFFLVLFIIMGAICYKTGWDMQTAGGGLLFAVPLIWIASVAGFFSMSYTGTSPFIDKYSVAMISSLIGFGYMFNKLAEGRG